MHTPHPIRVMVADGKPLIRAGLQAFLTLFDELQLVGEAQDGPEAIELCELIEPDLAIVDLHMPRQDGQAVTRAIRQRWPDIKVILLDDGSRKDLAQIAQEVGASGYLTKTISANDLHQAILRLFPQGAGAPHTGTQPAGEEGVELASGRPDLAQELAAAGKIQADLLPAQPPRLRGWDIAAHLEPARETSGDFFDFIPLANNNWGIVIADVTDKGMGAALFMALCSTLMRTYFTQYPTLPALAVSTVNDRLLSDSRGDMFVTAFYGVLETDTGRLRYVNAGHNPPLLVSCKKGQPVEPLRPTGMALGVSAEAHWGQKLVRFSPGDLLILYTDGITEAQDPRGRFFGDERLRQLSRTLHGRPAAHIQETLLSEVQRFSNDSLQDDVALMVIARK
ncbi:MAG: SpoIIE family protein phosphatase [Chloroflexota bacterium]